MMASCCQVVIFIKRVSFVMFGTLDLDMSYVCAVLCLL
jgi:hypothetical protein